jgi:hypothetical protein
MNMTRYSRVMPVKRLLDPYTGRYITSDSGEDLILPESKATFHIEMGEATLVEANVAPPWGDTPPKPAKKKRGIWDEKSMV